MNAQQSKKYERSFAISRIRLLAAIDAGAVNDDVEPARVADGRRDVFLDCLFACNVANCARSLAADSLDPSVVSFNVDSVRPVVVTIALSAAKRSRKPARVRHRRW